MAKRYKRKLLGGFIIIAAVAGLLLADGELSNNDLSFILDAIDFVFGLLR